MISVVYQSKWPDGSSWFQHIIHCEAFWFSKHKCTFFWKLFLSFVSFVDFSSLYHMHCQLVLMVASLWQWSPSFTYSVLALTQPIRKAEPFVQDISSGGVFCSWNSLQRSFKVSGNVTILLITHSFLLAFHFTCVLCCIDLSSMTFSYWKTSQLDLYTVSQKTSHLWLALILTYTIQLR